MDNLIEDVAGGDSNPTPEQEELMAQARKAGFDLIKPTQDIASRIIQAANSPPAATLRVTDNTSDEELTSLIRGRKRG